MHAFVGKAAGTEVDFLFDSGASTNYVSSAFAKMHGLTVKPSNINVRLGTGDSVPAQGKCFVHIKLGDYQDRVECYVLDMVTDFQMILGDTWLNMVKAMLRLCLVKSNRTLDSYL
jgi:predicted aspartyl protease